MFDQSYEERTEKNKNSENRVAVYRIENISIQETPKCIATEFTHKIPSYVFQSRRSR